MLGDVFDIFPPRDEIVLVVVLFGTNDSALNHLSLTQHVPIAEYAENLSTIVNKLRRRSKFVVLRPHLLARREADCSPKEAVSERCNGLP